MSGFLTRYAGILPGVWGKRLVLFGLFVIAAFLLLYNLEFSPRPWHDEGAALSVSKTLVEDGVYAVRNLDEYQTFGPVQSVGPTVLLPVALSFRLFGVSLAHGRVVVALYSLLTLVAFYALASKLFGDRTALLAVALLLGSHAAQFLHLGRQVLGEVPALGFFLGGCLVYSLSMEARRGRFWLCLIAGLLVGAAIVTKSSYTMMGLGSFALLIILDLIYYRQGQAKYSLVVVLAASACAAMWSGWQLAYYGADTFFENVAKYRQLAAYSTGFHLSTSIAAFKSIFGPTADYFFFFLGCPALIYAALLSLRRSQEGFRLALLTIFGAMELAFYLFWSVPGFHLLVPAAVSAIFVAKFCRDLLSRLAISLSGFWMEIRQGQPAGFILSAVALMALGLMVLYPLQSVVRTETLAKDRGPHDFAILLEGSVEKDAVVETWERELNILTDLKYHYPDQSMMAYTGRAIYQGGDRDYALGAAYFQNYRPSYVVVGWFARWTGIYDMSFLEQYACRVATAGEGELRYEVYALHLGDQKKECP
jgi:hypothetical protein